MLQICLYAEEHLGLHHPDSHRSTIDMTCNEYVQKQPDPGHPVSLPRICGNCVSWALVDEKQYNADLAAEKGG